MLPDLQRSRGPKERSKSVSIRTLGQRKKTGEIVRIVKLCLENLELKANPVLCHVRLRNDSYDAVRSEVHVFILSVVEDRVKLPLRAKTVELFFAD
jgi:hypothetical protein